MQQQQQQQSDQLAAGAAAMAVGILELFLHAVNDESAERLGAALTLRIRALHCAHSADPCALRALHGAHSADPCALGTEHVSLSTPA